MEGSTEEPTFVVGKEEPTNDEHNDEDSYDDDSLDDDDESYSSYDSEIEQEAQRLMDALHGGGAPPSSTTPTPAPKTPQQVWAEFVQGIPTFGSLKVTDSLVTWITKLPQDQQPSHIQQLCVDLQSAIQSTDELLHVILGRVFLSLLSPTQHQALYQALVSKHQSTISYWKLGSDDSTQVCGIPTTALLQQLLSDGGEDWTSLTELELRGLELSTITDIDLLVRLLPSAPKLRQANVLGMVLSETLITTEGLFDNILETVQGMSGFDELQLSCCRSGPDDSDASNVPSNVVALVSPSALEQLLSVKPKWWRMTLDGMGLSDRHVAILASALKDSKDCKMNDLLSIQDNPNISPGALETLYTICLAKQRMGLVQCDDPTWVATFDLVRPLNNLHRRLEYFNDQGKYRSKDEWIEWLVVIGNLPWIDDKRKINYLWFTLLEQPDMLLSSLVDPTPKVATKDSLKRKAANG